ncbi:hypothetical protein [Telmatospirillum sp. J64-1]|uniref:hypothetical protein n=1 Tax=Telmatospirillum sp. J64-1 TaxID=2502183 RepID=UPI00115D2F43|nr:hypothetical protein [Telmatospirillum sp. J64-1]
MKTIIMSVLALVALIAAAVGGMAYMGITPFENILNAQSGSEEKPPPAAPPPPQSAFIDLEPFLVPIIRDGELLGQVFLVMQLEVDPAYRSRVTEAMPRLRDGFLRDFHAFLPAHLQYYPQPDENAVKYRLNIIGNRIVGEGAVRDVVFREVSLR